jgi:CBS domain-containing protein
MSDNKEDNNNWLKCLENYGLICGTAISEQNCCKLYTNFYKYGITIIIYLKDKLCSYIIMPTTINDIMRKQLETIDAIASVQQAAKKMKDRNVSSLVVVDENGKPQGLVSERDLVTKVCTTDVPIHSIKNKEIMSSPLITIRSSSSPSKAADMMLQHNVRHLLVIDNDNDTDNADKPIGVITPLDFTRHQKYVANEDREAIEKMLEYYI